MTLAQMKKAAQQIGPMALGVMPIAGTLKHGWIIPPYNTGDGGTDYISRLLHCSCSWGLLGIPKESDRLNSRFMFSFARDFISRFGPQGRVRYSNVGFFSLAAWFDKSW
jgi:hypothetical protein